MTQFDFTHKPCHHTNHSHRTAKMFKQRLQKRKIYLFIFLNVSIGGWRKQTIATNKLGSESLNRPCSLVSMVMWGKLPSTAMTSSYFSSPRTRSMLRLSESLRLTRSCSVRTLYCGRRRRRRMNIRSSHTSHPEPSPETTTCVRLRGYLLGDAVAEVLLLKVWQLQQRRLGLLQALHDHLRQFHAVLDGDQTWGVKTCGTHEGRRALKRREKGRGKKRCVSLRGLTSSTAGHHGELTAHVDHLLQKSRTLPHHEPLIWSTKTRDEFSYWTVVSRCTTSSAIPVFH